MNTGGAVFQSRAWSLWPDGEGGEEGRRGGSGEGGRREGGGRGEGQKRGGIS